MSKYIIPVLFLLLCSTNVNAKDKWPDGTAVSEWFAKTNRMDVNSLGKQYVITDHGVKQDSTLLQTVQIQAVIDKAAENGGGVVVIPKGTFLIGSLFFKPGTHLHLQKGAVLKGSDFIGDFKLIDTRMEGQNLKYFAALVNAIDCDGFTLSGEGSINGNGAIGNSSGFAANITVNVPILMKCVRGWFLFRAAMMCSLRECDL